MVVANGTGGIPPRLSGRALDGMLSERAPDVPICTRIGGIPSPLAMEKSLLKPSKAFSRKGVVRSAAAFSQELVQARARPSIARKAYHGREGWSASRSLQAADGSKETDSSWE